MQISCSVQADLGFLNDFMPRAAQVKMQQDALESLFFGAEEECVNIAPDEPQPVPGWQGGLLAGEVSGLGEVLRLSPTPPSTLGSWLAGLSSALSSCLRAVLGACSSGLGCLIGQGKCPGSGNRA